MKNMDTTKMKWSKPSMFLLSNSINTGANSMANAEMMGTCYINVDTTGSNVGTCLISFTPTDMNTMAAGPIMSCANTVILESSAFACS